MNEYESPLLLIAVVDHNKHKRLEDILIEKHVRFQYLISAMGTAHSEVLKAFGLSGTEKTVGLCVIQRGKARQVMTSVTERLEMTSPGHGIVCTIPLSGVSKSIARAFEAENNEHAEDNHMEHSETNGEKYEMVIAITDNGYSEEVMDAARSVQARGGTVLHARQTAVGDAAKFFGIALQPDKEMIMIMIEKSRKLELMQAISKVCGMHTDAHGLVIALPVESCAGLASAESVS